MKRGKKLARLHRRIDSNRRKELRRNDCARAPARRRLTKSRRIFGGDVECVGRTQFNVWRAHGHRAGVELVERAAGGKQEGKFRRSRFVRRE